MFSTGRGVCMEQLPPCLLSTHREDGLAEDTIIIFRKQEVFIDFIHVFPISGIAHVLHYFAPYLSQPRHPTMSIRTTWKIKIRLKSGFCFAVFMYIVGYREDVFTKFLLLVETFNSPALVCWSGRKTRSHPIIAGYI